MRFKIQYGKTRTDKWGHILPSLMYDVFKGTLEEAVKTATEISNKYKSYDVLVIDRRGPELEEGRTWLVYSYKGGVCIFKNEDYFTL